MQQTLSSLADAVDTFVMHRLLQVNDPSSSTPSLTNPYMTYSYDKLSCLRPFYFLHIIFNYLVFFSGIACMVTRMVPPQWRWLHKWFGLSFTINMIWAIFSSLLIHNTGLPVATLISFAFVGGGLTVGWVVIRFYQLNMSNQAMQRVQQTLLTKTMPKTASDEDTTTTSLDLVVLLQQAKQDILKEQTFLQRFFSLKTLHGVAFFVSWFQLAGRIFASNQSGDFTCYTYPVYKPIDTPEGGMHAGNLTLVPTNDPNWDRLPWSKGVVSWSLTIVFSSMAVAIVVGAFMTYIATRMDHAPNRHARNEAAESGDNTEEVGQVPASEENGNGSAAMVGKEAPATESEVNAEDAA